MIDNYNCELGNKEQLLKNESDNGPYNFVKSVNASDSFAYAANLKMNDLVGTNSYLYFENGWSSTLRFNASTNICDLKYQESKYLWLGDQKSSLNGRREIIYEIMDGKNSAKTIQMDGNQYANSIILTPNHIVISGYTNEQTPLFPEERMGIDSYLLFINRNDFNIDNSLMLPCEKDDKILSLEFKNNYIYAMQLIDNKTIRLMKIDLFGNIIAENNAIYPYGVNNPNLRMLDDKIYLSFAYYDYNHLDYVDHIEEIDESLNHKVLYDKYNKQLKVIDFDYPSDECFQVLLGYKNGNKGYMYELYYQNNLVLDYYNDTYLPKAINHNNIILALDDKIMVNKLHTLFIETPPPEELDPKFDDESIIDKYNVLIDGKRCLYADDSKLDFDINQFGYYDLSYHFDNDFDFVYQQTLFVKPFVGIMDNNTYQKGLTIKGNGEAIVNGEQVSLPYEFNDVGHYVIQLIGSNGLLDNLSIDIVDDFENVILKEDEHVLEVQYENSTITPKLDVNYQKRTTELNKNNNFLFVYLAPLFAVAIGYLIIRKER